MTGKHLNLVLCGAGPAADAAALIRLAQEQSWTVTVTATQAALSFIDTAELERLSGSAVRTDYGVASSHEREVRPVNALLIAPATYNTINKLALGIADTYVLTSVAEIVGRRVPTVIVPFVNAALATRRPFVSSVESLRQEGIAVVLGQTSSWLPHKPGTGRSQQTRFPWEAALRYLDRGNGAGHPRD
ncbi:flavoprotein [Catellatospora sp. NPDC049133]|uniref:flavoprotein n=1 Tax=Catellatospora sp. NPDC049133 TaxID=3155499 RepID=UPI0033E46DCF